MTVEPTLAIVVASLAVTAMLAGLCWTVQLQVPLHNRLERNGPDDLVIARLVQTNWLRTLAWTARVVLLGWLTLHG